ncbi:hypothetical protein D9758_003830 [Tetrapyrgos nigripes]|uniref:Retroviral polymerase SH3-like domain-containing protein n=1 Tax=Tetrapyrgos nigripes TaxID=182062 RepID=A0A8H5LS70_9AGAR|nr:hypothetical protein D9758_003830 [Tetrapyrgos nigripes]
MKTRELGEYKICDTYSPYIEKGGSSREGVDFDIVGMGDVRVEVTYKGVLCQLLFRNAFHAPNVSSNLLSTGVLNKLGYTNTTANGCMVFQNPQGVEIFEAVLERGIYVMNANPVGPQRPLSNVTQLPMDIQYLHRASGHIMPERIEMALKLVDGYPEIKGMRKKMGTCEDCKKAHTDKQPHPESLEKITETNFRWYLDVWGPAQVVSVGGNKYALFGMDAATLKNMRGVVPEEQNVSHLVPFGSIGFAHIPAKTGRGKLDARGFKCQMVGYEGRKVYLVKWWETDELYQTSDVVFERSESHWILELEGENNEDLLFLAPTQKSETPSLDQPTSDQQSYPEPINDLAALKLKFGEPYPCVHLPAPAYEDGEREAYKRGEEWMKDEEQDNELLLEFDEEDEPIALNTQSNMICEPENTWVLHSYTEAMKRPDLWLRAMEKELTKLDSRKAFTPVSKPEDVKVITTRWVYALRLDGNGKITERRARLVVRGIDRGLLVAAG